MPNLNPLFLKGLVDQPGKGQSLLVVPMQADGIGADGDGLAGLAGDASLLYGSYHPLCGKVLIGDDGVGKRSGH